MTLEKRKYRIAIDARLVTSNIVGISRYCLNLILELIHKTDIDLFCLVNNDYLKTELELRGNRNQVSYIYAKSRPISFYENIEIPFLISRYRIDLFHATSYMTPVWVPCKFVYSILDTYHLIFPQGFSWFAQVYFKFIVRTAAKKANAIITISKSSCEDIKKYIINNKAISVTYLGFNENPPNVKPLNNIYEKYKLSNSKYMLYIGNHRYHKNATRVLAAYSELCDKVIYPPKLLLNLPETEERILLLKNTLSRQNVTFLGFIDEEDLFSFYKHAICLIAPSLYEGFGLFILEAMAAGTPVITSNISSMPEVGGDAVLYVDPYDVEAIASAMEKIDSDGSLRNDLIQKGYLQKSKFSWEKCAKETLDVYYKVLTNV